MIIIIGGTTHTGKTLLAQNLLEKYKYPYLSIDHLKMGLIRSGNTNLNPLSSDEELTSYLWPITKEIIKTAIENKQNLIVEGCYVPFNFLNDFETSYLMEIKHVYLIMSKYYIENNFNKIVKYANIIESRLYDIDCSKEELINSNNEFLKKCQEYKLNYILINDKYDINEQIGKYL